MQILSPRFYSRFCPTNY